MPKPESFTSLKMIILMVLLYSCTPKGDSGREQGYSGAFIDTLAIPAMSGSLSINGKLDDPAWQDARILALENKEIKVFGDGGESRIAVRGNYVCLSARVPESARLVARSTGINPSWWSEDVIVWTFRLRSPATQTNLWNLALTVNPLGAHSLTNRGLDVNSPTTTLDWAGDIKVAASIEKEEWTVEAAIPLEHFGTIGLVKAERIRAPRPDTPELRWYWPRANEFYNYQLVKRKTEPAPFFSPPAFPVNPAITRPVSPESALAAEIASLPKQAWTAKQQETLRIEAMLGNSIQSRINTFAEKEKLAWQEVQTLEEWEHFRDQRMEAMKKSLGSLPSRTPLRSVVTRRINHSHGFIIENIVYESQPGLFATANLYLPEKPSGKIPAIVVAHSHHRPKGQLELQDMGMTWARSGTAVLVMDLLCAGERSQSQPWPGESYYGRYALGNQLFLTGESLLKWMVWDIMRGIDLLLERSYIDPNRIIMLGAVAGGGDPAALTANFDKRIAAVIPFNFGEAGPEEHYTMGPRLYDFESADPGWAYWETTRSLPKSVSEQFFDWLICAALAPRNFIFSFEAGWPKSVENEPIWVRYKKVFDFYGARDHLASVDGIGPFPGPGECVNVGTLHRKRFEPILNRWLRVPIPDVHYSNPLPESELTCLTPAAAIDFSPRPVLLEELVSGRNKLVSEEVMEKEYGTQTSRFVLSEKQGDLTLAEWLSRELRTIINH